MKIQRIRSSFRSMRWKLTQSYTAVTVGSLLIVVLTLGFLVFSRVFIPIDIYNDVLKPQEWIRIIRENDSPLLRAVMSQEPIDTQLIAELLQYGDLQITHYDTQIGDFQMQFRTVGQGVTFLVDQEGILVGTSDPNWISEDAIGKPLDTGLLPDLDILINTALDGETDPDRLFFNIEPNERFYFTFPIFDKDNLEVLGVAIIYVYHVPTSEDIPGSIWALLGQSVLILLLAAGVVGTIFGALTARGMVSRLERVSLVTDAWSQGDFSEFIDDPSGDEISQLAVRLNHMADQLQQFIKRSQEMAISEERNRLARDLHDSAKQEALAASFHLGTALTLFENDPQSVKSHLKEADNLVNSVRRELTDLIHELRPPSMNGARFDETINEYLIEWAHQTGIEATIKVEGYIDLPLGIKQAIYRIMQEALANVARHSSAIKVDLYLNFREKSVEFCVRDDGVGFDTKQPHDGMGLESMRERTESLNGEFSIQSDLSQETIICVTFPID